MIISGVSGGWSDPGGREASLSVDLLHWREENPHEVH